jgi:hypothetical protein
MYGALSLFEVGDCLSCFTVSQSFSLSGRETWVGAFLIVDHFPSPSASTRRGFRWLLPRAGPVDRRDFQSGILLWYGRTSLVRPEIPANRNEQPIAARSVFEGEEE